jgi:hypothetical protein
MLTKDKLYILVKMYCEITDGVWTVTESASERFDLSGFKFSEVFRGAPPQFQQSFGRGQFSKNNLLMNKLNDSKSANNANQSLNKSKSNATASPHANKKQPNGNNNTSINKSKSQTPSKPSAKSPSKPETNGKSKAKQPEASGKSKAKGQANKPEATVGVNQLNGTHKNTANGSLVNKNLKLNDSTDDDSSVVDQDMDEANEFALKIVRILSMKVLDMDEEEFSIWRDYVPDEDMRECQLIEIEADKIFRREERERERVRLREEKNKQKEYLKELKKPKEDTECEDLAPLPEPTPIKSKITQEMFGDAIMILEFLNHFGDLFNLKDDFPNGFNFDLLENALFSKTYDSALCNLLLFYLDSIFKCFDEEKFDGESDEESEMDLSDEETEEAGEAEDVEKRLHLEDLFREPIKNATDRDTYADQADELYRFVWKMQGRPLKNIGLDVYTISEMLRLYFVTSGAEHVSKTKFWFQQRGGYTRMDEAGIDFGLNEKHVIKKLETMNVFELEPGEKLKILTCLCHQLQSQTSFRDLIEDNFQKLSTLRAQLRDLQTDENRRLREETSERWRKKMQDKAQEKAKLEEIKQAKAAAAVNSESADANKPSKDRNSLSNDSIPAANKDEPANGQLLSRQEEHARQLEEKQIVESNKKREEFLRRESKLNDEIYKIQLKCSMMPLGKDRFYQRYWVFKSVPGVFVENDTYENLEIDTKPSETDSNVNSIR